MPRPSLRCFLAVFPSAGVRDRLAETIQRWTAEGDPIKWVAPENLHVTLKFLGQVEEADTVTIARAVAGITASHDRYTAGVRGIGAYPNISRPRTIWAGFSAGREETRSLAKSMEDCCSKLGFKRERRSFSPHITLGRRQGHGLATSAPDLRDLSDVDFGEFLVEEVCLMSSNLRRAGPTYVRLATAELA